jgi:hypothetical protein
MQYSYTFSHRNGLRYTIVASRYSQARAYFLKFSTDSFVVTYNGGYHGTPVRNKTVINIK